MGEKKKVPCSDCGKRPFDYEDDPCPLCEDTGLVDEGTKGWKEKLLFGDIKQEKKSAR